MTPRRSVELRNGLAQTVASLVLAGGFVVLVATSDLSRNGAGTRVAAAGVALFAGALLFGSTRVLGLTTLPVLGGAFLAVAGAAEPAWVRSILLGGLWYVVVELAWDAIERRDGAARSPGFSNRRINEVTTVVILALGISTMAFLLSSYAPPRTLFAVGAVVLILLAGLAAATRRVRGASSGNDI